MPRLIDYEQAKRATYEEVFWTESEQAAVRNFLAKLPTVDAVEVVRCRDRRYSDFEYQQKNKGEEATSVCVCFYLNRHVRADDYCSFIARTDNKRKDGDG